MALQLETIPKILTALGLDDNDTAKIVAYNDAQKAAGQKTKPVGEVAVALSNENAPAEYKLEHKVSSAQLDQTLLQQVVNKAEAAVRDFEQIRTSGKQASAGKPLAPAWGNNGVNAAAEHPTITDGVSAAANSAANIALMANEKPSLAHNPKIKAGIEAASALALGIAGKIPLTGSQAKQLIQQARLGLTLTADGSGGEADIEGNLLVKDQKGKPVKLNDFIDERFKEIEAGLALRMEKVVKLHTASDVVQEQGARDPKVNIASTFDIPLHTPAQEGRRRRAPQPEVRFAEIYPSQGDVFVVAHKAFDHLTVHAKGNTYVGFKDAVAGSSQHARTINNDGGDLVVTFTPEQLSRADIKTNQRYPGQNGAFTEITLDGEKLFSSSRVVIAEVNDKNAITGQIAATDAVKTLDHAKLVRLEATGVDPKTASQEAGGTKMTADHATQATLPARTAGAQQQNLIP